MTRQISLNTFEKAWTECYGVMTELEVHEKELNIVLMKIELYQKEWKMPRNSFGLTNPTLAGFRTIVAMNQQAQQVLARIALTLEP